MVILFFSFLAKVYNTVEVKVIIMIDGICAKICSLLGRGDYVIRTMFRNKSLQIASENDNETMKRLEILTAEMSAKDEYVMSHEMLLSIAADNLDAPIWGKDTEGNFVFMNVACANRILKTTVADAMAPKDPGYVRNPIETVCFDSDMLVLETKKTHRFFEHARSEDGSDMWLDTTKSPWISNSELIGTVGFGSDVTTTIPEDVKEKYKESGYIEIAVDAIYNSDDIMQLIGDTNDQ